MAETEHMEFAHHTSAHCESGSTSNLFNHYGIDISEPVVFGIGSGMFYGYFPFIKVNGLPLITFRNLPGSLIRKAMKRLGVKIRIVKFKDPDESMTALNDMLAKGTPVGLQTSIYWLAYIPARMREHFNAHFIIAYGRDGDTYHISDPVFQQTFEASREGLMKARFAKGAFAPNGRMFYVTDVPKKVDLAPAVIKGIKETCFVMLRLPLPMVGVRGIRLFAKNLKKWPEKHGVRKTQLLLGNAVRLQEEIGTGGGGFRFMYAAFLQEAAGIMKDDRFLKLSQDMTAIGDRWREFAVSCARIYKNRAAERDTFEVLTEILLDCAEREEKLYRELSGIVR